jgi:hypothetical protein
LLRDRKTKAAAFLSRSRRFYHRSALLFFAENPAGPFLKSGLAASVLSAGRTIDDYISISPEKQHETL